MGDADYVAGLVAAASRAIASARYCWLATTGEAGALNARPMGRTPGEDAWTFRFVTDERSRKVAEIGRGGRVAVIVQRDAEEAYLSLAGEATVFPRASEDLAHWRDAYRVYFPGEGEERHAAFIEIRVDRMELWLRGVTPEPFGLRPTVLERDGAGGWRQVA